jgi:hypothetical protein
MPPVELVLDRSSVVLAGAWNQAIFSPSWVKERVFEGQDSEHWLGLLVTGGLIAQYSTPKVILTILPGRVDFKWRERSSNAAQEAEAAALRTLLALPETPIEAVGINLGFDVESVDCVLEVFMPPDATRLASTGAEVKTVALSRSLVLGQTTVTMVVGRNQAGQVQIDFNHNLPNLNRTGKSAAEVLRGKSQSAWSDSARLLKKLYSIELEGGT